MNALAFSNCFQLFPTFSNFSAAGVGVFSLRLCACLSLLFCCSVVGCWFVRDKIPALAGWLVGW